MKPIELNLLGNDLKRRLEEINNKEIEFEILSLGIEKDQAQIFDLFETRKNFPNFSNNIDKDLKFDRKKSIENSIYFMEILK